MHVGLSNAQILTSRLCDDWEKRVVNWVNDQEIFLYDNLGGFDDSMKNMLLDKIPPNLKVRTEYLLPDNIKKSYPTLDIRFDAELMIRGNHFRKFVRKAVPKNQTMENFVCSFFRTFYQGRVWLLCWLHELGWFAPDYGSKNFIIEKYPDEIKQLYFENIGNDFDHISKHAAREQMQQLIVCKNSNSCRSNHKDNLLSISDAIQKSFVCIVAETHPAHFYPFPTEKFLYPIVNGTLWVAYAQPGYHKFITEKLGFKLYDCFDYSFDSITDHIQRLAAMTDMLMKFSTMSLSDWQKVYDTQSKIIDYNSQHANSGQFITVLRQFDEVNAVKNSFPVDIAK